MFNINLMNIFEGLVRNYMNFNLTTENDKIEILKKELSYISIVGEVLGYSSIIKGINNESKSISDKIEIEWRNYNDEEGSVSNEVFLYFSQELDLSKDIITINNLVEKINNKIETKGFIQIIEVSSKGRIDYLNKILREGKRFKDVDVLIIYKVWNIRDRTSNYYSYLFEEDNLIKQKNAHLYYDQFGILKMKFI